MSAKVAEVKIGRSQWGPGCFPVAKILIPNMNDPFYFLDLHEPGKNVFLKAGKKTIAAIKIVSWDAYVTNELGYDYDVVERIELKLDGPCRFVCGPERVRTKKKWISGLREITHKNIHMYRVHGYYNWVVVDGPVPPQFRNEEKYTGTNHHYDRKRRKRYLEKHR